MALFAAHPLPQAALEAAAAFHGTVLPQLEKALEQALAADGEDLLLVFAPADHTHHAWRLAAVQGLARAHAPRRINAVASDDAAAIAAARSYIAQAPGLTGQLLALDGQGADGVL